MSSEDVAKIAAQEKALVFRAFDEAVAFDVGALIRARALAEKMRVVIDIRTWDRPLFYAALPGSTAANTDWARRKTNVVRRFLRSTYALVLEQQRPDRTFKPGDGLDIRDYVLAGGGFPVTVAGAGVIGVIAVSGLPEREDHETIVAALCAYLGHDPAALTLPVSVPDGG